MRHAPHGGIHAQESLDIVLTTAAFDQSVSLLFLDEGVFQLMQNQRPDAIGFKHIAPIFASLELYDVESLWVEHESLVERGLSLNHLILPLKPIARKDIARLMAEQDILVSC